MPKRTEKRAVQKKPRAPKTEPTPEVPPGATRKAWERAIDPGGGKPGSGAGPVHAAGDEGSEIETTGPLDTNWTPASPPAEEEDALESGPPYAGISGGAVG